MIRLYVVSNYKVRMYGQLEAINDTFVCCIKL